ncbi:MAG: retropepsin-like domain-containing protein [Anaerococcus sp.]|nr:retropepsin-like domain-containing protein [Anaerococcus sp.]
MEFTPIPLADKKFYNYIFLGILAAKKPVVAMFDTRGNTLIPEKLAKDLDLNYIDDKAIDEEKGFRRAILSTMTLGGLKLEQVPVLVCKDEVIDLGVDPVGNIFPAEMVLGWNVISQFVFRGDLRKGKFEVQSSDFKKPSQKQRLNQPVFNIVFNDKTYKAALDTSRPLTIISEKIAKDIKVKNEDVASTIKMLGLDKEEVVYESKFTFKIDDEEVKIPTTQVEKALNDKDIQVVFGADFLRLTSWSLYNPMGYVRARN